MLKLAADLAERTQFSFVSVWNLVCKWQSEGLL
jgi:hypothetical protein